jgi:hypothetical protein
MGKEGGSMKKVIAVLIALGLCGLYWLGCQKKEAPMPEKAPAAVAEPAPAVTPPPPPPPPPPAGGEEKTGE